jgi:molybdopterin-guanine dinucleotide biosynthesis protein A
MGTDKAILEVAGRAMSVRVAAALADGGCDPVFAVGGAAALLREAGLEVVADRHPGEGPLGAILTALRHVAGTHDGVLVAACDLPWLDGRAVAAVAAALGHHDVAAGRADGPQHLLAAWSTRALTRVQAQFEGGERAVRRATAELDLVEVPVEIAVMRNVNTPADLADVRRATRAGDTGNR